LCQRQLPEASVVPRRISSSQTIAFGSVTIISARPEFGAGIGLRCAKIVTPQTEMKRAARQILDFISARFTETMRALQADSAEFMVARLLRRKASGCNLRSKYQPTECACGPLGRLR